VACPHGLEGWRQLTCLEHQRANVRMMSTTSSTDTPTVPSTILVASLMSSPLLPVH
jgi:hypothetical protein